MEIRAGTSGYSYPAWRGSFYPEKLAPAAMLAYYAERLPAVEINNTFYRMPKREVVETWARSVPESFRFAVKVSQRITHRKRLIDVERRPRSPARAARAARRAAGTAARAAAAEPVRRSRAPRALPRSSGRACAARVRVPAPLVAERVRARVPARARRGAGRVGERRSRRHLRGDRRIRLPAASPRRSTSPALSRIGCSACAVSPGTRRTCSSSTSWAAPRSPRSSTRSRAAAVRSRYADSRARARRAEAGASPRALDRDRCARVRARHRAARARTRLDRARRRGRAAARALPADRHEQPARQRARCGGLLRGALRARGNRVADLRVGAGAARASSPAVGRRLAAEPSSSCTTWTWCPREADLERATPFGGEIRDGGSAGAARST